MRAELIDQHNAHTVASLPGDAVTKQRRIFRSNAVIRIIYSVIWRFQQQIKGACVRLALNIAYSIVDLVIVGHVGDVNTSDTGSLLRAVTASAVEV